MAGAAIPACALMAPMNAQADSILSLDFDNNSGSYRYGYTYAFYGDAGYGYHDLISYISQESDIFGGIGIGGSNALRITADSSAIFDQLPPDRTYEGWSYVIVEDAALSALTSPKLGDYTLSLSGRGEGSSTRRRMKSLLRPRPAMP